MAKAFFVQKLLRFDLQVLSHVKTQRFGWRLPDLFSTSGKALGKLLVPLWANKEVMV